MTRTFPNTGEPFSGLLAARAWCRENDHACGTPAGGPIGVHRGRETRIEKWRNMTIRQRASLDGRLVPVFGSWKNDGVVLVLTGGPLA